jgi:hypothetical protein
MAWHKVLAVRARAFARPFVNVPYVEQLDVRLEGGSYVVFGQHLVGCWLVSTDSHPAA